MDLRKPFAGLRRASLAHVALAVAAVLISTAATASAQTCGTAGQFCNNSAACDDGDPCNGAETCSRPDIIRFCRCASTPPCYDGLPCTNDECFRNPADPSIVICPHFPIDCTDGMFCNGAEVCEAATGACVAGPNPCGHTRGCNEDLNQCMECTTNSHCTGGDPCTRPHCVLPEGRCEYLSCDDGLHCNGRERCLLLSCAAGTPPCEAPLMCDEAGNRCVECFSNADCGDIYPCTVDTCVDGVCGHAWCMDGLFCNGRELCHPNGCQPGQSPCANPGLCDEGNDRCGDCVTAAECADDDDCTIEECDADWLTCRTSPCTLAFRTPDDGAVFPVGDVIDVSGVGPGGLDVALVFGNSASLNATEFIYLRNFGLLLMDGLPPYSEATGTKAGFTTFESSSKRVLDLSSNKQTAVESILSLSSTTNGSCVGCGIDDGDDNLRTHGRSGATKALILVMESPNSLPEDSFGHFYGALRAADFHGDVIFAIGIGEPLPQVEVFLAATPLPNTQTAFLVPDVLLLYQVVSPILTALSAISLNTVEVTMPDGIELTAPVDASRIFTVEDWSILPGENRFTARIQTLYGEQSAALTLYGVYPCTADCGDANDDADIDLRDMAVFQRCFGQAPYDALECACADLNGDLTMNLVDWKLAVSAWNAPSKLQPPNCVMP